MQLHGVDLLVSRQKGGLWRVEVPGLDGCFVDGVTVQQALYDIDAAAAMFIDLYQAEGRELPDSVQPAGRQSYKARLPVATGEHQMKRAPNTGRRRAPV